MIGWNISFSKLDFLISRFIFFIIISTFPYNLSRSLIFPKSLGSSLYFSVQKIYGMSLIKRSTIHLASLYSTISHPQEWCSWNSSGAKPICSVSASLMQSKLFLLRSYPIILLPSYAAASRLVPRPAALSTTKSPSLLK